MSDLKSSIERRGGVDVACLAADKVLRGEAPSGPTAGPLRGGARGGSARLRWGQPVSRARGRPTTAACGAFPGMIGSGERNHLLHKV
jgi:hypothetical protein